jgi:hypothetical protein
MDTQLGWFDVGRASLRRAVNMLLSVVLLTQPGCMCGCSTSQRTACLSTECDGSGTLCSTHETIGFPSSESFDFDLNATEFESPWCRAWKLSGWGIKVAQFARPQSRSPPATFSVLSFCRSPTSCSKLKEKAM